MFIFSQLRNTYCIVRIGGMGVSDDDWAARRSGPVLDVSRADLQKCSIGRLELVQWANQLLELDYATLVDFSDGIAFVQFLDIVSPNAAPLQKVQFDAHGVDANRKNMRCVRWLPAAHG